MPVTIAYFVSPHGYGHAARASAVINAIAARRPALHFDIFSLTPEWFFAESLTAPFTYHPLLTDIGLVQTNSMQENLPGTIERLNEFLPFGPARLRQLATQLGPRCRLVLCDIAPLGIAVAQELGAPAALIENFTWDWIYEGYPGFAAELQPHVGYLRRLFSAATYHIQTEPVCLPQPAHLAVPPVSRQIREDAATVRRKLNLSPGSKMVLLTMGGNRWDFSALDRLSRFKNIHFVIAGADGVPANAPANLICLPRHGSGFFHPDLINAADAVIGKVGYSTLAEAYQAGIPFGYMARSQFRESPYLTAYIEANLPALEFTEAEFTGSSWLDKVPALVNLPKIKRQPTNGAAKIARFIEEILA